VDISPGMHIENTSEIEIDLTGRLSIRILRIYAFMIGVGICIWIPFEDGNLRWVIIFALAIAIWLALRLSLITIKGKILSNLAYLLIGLLVGISVTPFAIGLILVKNGIHGHLVPDFTYEDIMFLIQTVYVWGIAGLFIGSGFLMLNISKKYKAEDKNANCS